MLGPNEGGHVSLRDDCLHVSIISERVEEGRHEGQKEEGKVGEKERENGVGGTSHARIVDAGCVGRADIAVDGVLSFEAVEALAALGGTVFAEGA